MDELSEMLNKIMSDPDSMQQIQAVASSLGLTGETGAALPQPAPPSAPASTQNSGGLDLSGLSALLGGLGQQQPPVQPATPDLSAIASLLSGLKSQPQPQPQGLPDISALSGLLGNLAGGNQQAAGPAPAGPDLSALTALLSGGNPARQTAPGIPSGIDINMIMKLSQALSSLQSNKANVDLLLALKPRLKEERAKKVDDAIRVMQLIQFLPLIKESGLFGEMDKILGGLGGLVGGSGGSLGGLLGNVGSGLGGILGGLGGRR